MSFFIILCVHADNITVQGQMAAKVPIFVGIVQSWAENKSDEQLIRMAQTVQKDFMFSGQCDVTVQACKPMTVTKSSRMFKKLSKKGYMLALFIKRISSDAFEWCVCDTASGHVLCAKQFHGQSLLARAQGHAMADEIWPLLMGQEGCFSSKLAYCKECVTNTGVEKHIYIADYDGSGEQLLVKAPTIAIAPRWNKDPQRPLLFYSSYTPVNMRLMMTDMRRRSSIASDYPGITMQPSFSADGKAVVYCASGGKGSCQLWHCSKKGIVQLTNNGGNNIAPIFGDNDILYFCSDAYTGNPLICAYDMKNQEVTMITSDGYAASPHYNPQKKQLVYAKMVQGIMQLFIYDIRSNTERQITFEGNNKHESCWSPCGTYIAYAAESRGKSRLFVYSTITGATRALTPAGSNCSYPAWSGKYVHFPHVV